MVFAAALAVPAFSLSARHSLKQAQRLLVPVIALDYPCQDGYQIGLNYKVADYFVKLSLESRIDCLIKGESSRGGGLELFQKGEKVFVLAQFLFYAVKPICKWDYVASTLDVVRGLARIFC